jgi:ATP-dependent RNA helicase DeaD
VEGKRATAFADALRETLEKGEYKRHDELLDRLLEQNYSPTDIASALIHLLGEDKSREAEAIPEDRRPVRPAPDHDHARRRSHRRDPDPSAKARRERGRDEYEPQKRSRSREEPGAVSHEAGMVRLAFNVGRAHSVSPGDFVGVITGVTAIPKGEIGAIHLQDTKTFVDVAEARVALVLKKLNGIKFKGRKLLVRVAV